MGRYFTSSTRLLHLRSPWTSIPWRVRNWWTCTVSLYWNDCITCRRHMGVLLGYLAASVAEESIGTGEVRSSIIEFTCVPLYEHSDGVHRWYRYGMTFEFISARSQRIYFDISVNAWLNSNRNTLCACAREIDPSGFDHRLSRPTCGRYTWQKEIQ